MSWIVPKINWSPDDEFTNDDMNRIEGDILELKTLDDAQTEIIEDVYDQDLTIEGDKTFENGMVLPGGYKYSDDVYEFGDATVWTGIPVKKDINMSTQFIIDRDFINVNLLSLVILKDADTNFDTDPAAYSCLISTALFTADIGVSRISTGVYTERYSGSTMTLTVDNYHSHPANFSGTQYDDAESLRAILFLNYKKGSV